MAISKVNFHGQTYKWGVDASTMPSITGFTARGASSDTAPEVFSPATDGEGHVEAVAISKPANRTINLSLTGYVNDSWDKTTVANSFSYLTRFFLIQKIGEPQKKGDFWEVTIDAVSYAGVTS